MGVVMSISKHHLPAKCIFAIFQILFLSLFLIPKANNTSDFTMYNNYDKGNSSDPFKYG